MQANKDPFIKKFNILDDLCKRRYPECPKGFSAIKKFAETLQGADKDTLKSIILLRNTIHDQRNLVSINSDCLKFMDGLIKGLQSNTKGPIDADLENLRSNNLQKMSEMLKHLSSKTHMISVVEQSKIKAKLMDYIECEKRASSIERAKKFYFDFCAYYNNIHNLSAVKEARAEHRERSIERKRQSVLSQIQHFYNQALVAVEDEPFFSRGKLKKKLKQIFEGYRTRVLSCYDFDDLDDLLDNAEIDLDPDYE